MVQRSWGTMAISLSRGLFGPIARNHCSVARATTLCCHWASVAAFQYPVFSNLPKASCYKKRFAAMATAATPSQTSSERQEAEFWDHVIAHQKTAARLSAIEEARTLVHRSLDACLSTISQKYEGFPYGSFLDVAADDEGRLITAVSSLASHRKDLEMNPKCCLFIMKDKSDRKDVIITYLGEAFEVPDIEKKKVRDIFLSKHPEAFWVDFGDFTFFRIEPKHIRYLTGSATPFNASGEFSGEDFKNAKVDPIAQFSAPIAAHMNKDHADETQLIVQKALGVHVDFAKIIDLDKLGLNVQVGFQGKPIKLRVAFPRPAEDRRDVKTLIVQMVEDSK